MKLLVLMALGLMMTTPAFASEVSDLVKEKYHLALSNSRQVADREMNDGKNANIVNQGILDTFVTNTHRIKINLEVTGNHQNKNVDARLVVYLNNEHGGMILDVNKILSPLVQISAQTKRQYQGETLVTQTKMYVPIDLYAPGAMASRLAILTMAIQNGRFGQVSAKR